MRLSSILVTFVSLGLHVRKMLMLVRCGSEASVGEGGKAAVGDEKAAGLDVGGTSLTASEGVPFDGVEGENPRVPGLWSVGSRTVC